MSQPKPDDRHPRLAAARARPPAESDFDHASNAIREAKRLASRAKSRISSRMDPQGLTWEEAADLANAAQSVAYHAGWMLAKLRSQAQGVAAVLDGRSEVMP